LILKAYEEASSSALRPVGLNTTNGKTMPMKAIAQLKTTFIGL